MKKINFNRAFYVKKNNIGRKLINFNELLICFILTSLILSACSKSDKKDDGLKPSNDYYFRATLNGTKKDFHTVKFQGGGNDNRWEHVVIGGYESSFTGTNVPPSLDFEIWRNGGNISMGTFVTTTEPLMIAHYAVQTGAGTLLYNTINANNVFTVKIDAISKDGIRGSFGGTLTNNAGASINVTDGTFNLPYDQLVNP